MYDLFLGVGRGAMICAMCYIKLCIQEKTAGELVPVIASWWHH